MNLPSIRRKIRIIAVPMTGILLSASWCLAQGTDPNKVPDVEQQQNQDQQLKQRQLDQSASPAGKVDPQEEAAYKAFYDADPKDPDTKIRLGQAFLEKYPSSRYAESVYAGMTQAYYGKQDWKDFYDNADKALALNPNDVPILAMVGWVIPHMYNPNDPNAAKDLDKAEQYEKHAIELLATMQKPANVADDQFAKSKSALEGEAHSGLGLVYFRKRQPDDSVKELQQAAEDSASPDATDLFVLGVDLQSLHRYPDAADAFNRCAQISSALQDRCKQSADAAKKQPAPSK